MSKSNFKNNSYFKSEITNITSSSSDSTFLITLKIKLEKFFQDRDEEFHVIFRNSTDIVSFFSQTNKNIQIKQLKYYNVGSSTAITRSNIIGKIQSSNFETLDSQDYFVTIIKWKPSGSDYTSLSSGLNFNSSSSSSLTFSKIGSLKYINNSGTINRSYNKILQERNSEIGTLPSSKITTGNILTDFNDPYKEHNLVDFVEKNNVNISVGMPLFETNVTDKFYMTTSDNILNDSAGLISTSDNRFTKEFDLDNTEIFSTPNKLDSLSNQIKVTKKITSENLNHIIKQNRFEESFTPFEETKYYYDETPNNRSEFYTGAGLVFDDKDKFNLGEQKQIKIILDFSNDFNLHLINTKFSYIHPSTSLLKSSFQSGNSNNDRIYDTKYLNFMEGSNVETYSSHFAPTAYWSFTDSSWNYLDASDKGIKYDASDVQLPNNFIFSGTSSSSPIALDDINESHLKSFNSHFSRRPIMTTPSFRNDGSLIQTNTGESYNKSMLCQITDSYGFPYNYNWKPSSNNLLDMSKYIAKDFLLEKVIIKGKFTNKAELPLKVGNYIEARNQSGNSLANNNSSDFNSFQNDDYSLKQFDKEQLYLANSATFFILNERKNQNYFDLDLKVDSLLHYTNLLTDQFNFQNFNKSFGKNLENYLGEFTPSQEDLSIAYYRQENRELYELNRFNNKVKKTPSSTTNNLYKLKSGPGLSVHTKLYYKKRTDLDVTNFADDITASSSNVVGHYLPVQTIDYNSSRELVTYSNLLITKKRSQDYSGNSISFDYDSNMLNNIDYHHQITSNNVNSLNVDEPQEFTIKSLCKNNNYSDYLDESEYKIQSNFKKRVTDAKSVPNSFIIKNTSTNNGSDMLLLNYIASGPNVGYYIFSKKIGTSLPVVLPKFKLKIRKKSDNSIHDFINISFANKVPTTVNGNSGSYSNIAGKLFIKDFIEYSSTTGSNAVNNITINLKFLDWDLHSSSNVSVVPNFLSSSKTSTSLLEDVYNVSKNAIASRAFVLDLALNGGWSGLSFQQQTNSLSLLIAYAIFFKGDLDSTENYNLNTSFSSSTVSALSIFKNSAERFIRITKSVALPGQPVKISGIKVDEIRSDSLEFTFLNSSNDNVLFEDLFPSPQTRTEFSATDLVLGSDEVTRDLDYFQENYILEGKTRGSTNLKIDSNRVINKKLVNIDNIPIFRSNSGKYIQNGEGFNSAVNSNYLIKPSDKLIFGVSSYCNGQVMPTVFKLHDKLEITLIGRDFVDEDTEYKNNSSKSIRKTVIGDQFNTNTRETIYQTKDAYFDNIWNKNSLDNSLEEFKAGRGKEVVSKKSSRESGSYSGLSISLNEKQIQDNKKLTVVVKDTVNPSLGKVFKENLLLSEVKSTNNNNEVVNKIVISESYTSSSTLNIINNWHNNFHLAKIENNVIVKNSFFYDLNNFSLEENTISSFENTNKLEICYDISSYTPCPNVSQYKKIAESIQASRFNSASVQNIENFGKSMKTFVLPNSSIFSYQNGIQIQNQEKNRTNLQLPPSSSGERQFLRFVQSNSNFYNDPFLENNDLNNRIVIGSGSASLQYFDSMSNLTSLESSKIGRSLLKTYINDSHEISDTTVDFNPQWNLVLEINLATFKVLYNASLTIKDVNENFKGKEIHLFLHQNNDVDDNNNYTDLGISKVGRVIKVDQTNEIITLAIPLYFWETLEVDEDFLTNNSFLHYGKTTQKANDYDKLNPAWYATLNDGTKIIDDQDIYKNFVDANQHTSINTAYTSNNNKSYPIMSAIQNSEGNKQDPSVLPYTYSDLSALTNSSEKLTLTTEFYISLSSFVIYKNTGIDVSPIHSLNIKYDLGKIQGVNTDFRIDLLNNYKLDFHKKFLTHEKYFERDNDAISFREIEGLSKDDENDNFFLNEKVYRSKIYKKKESYFVPTNDYLIYKIHQMYVNEAGISSTVDNPINEYNIVEIIGSDTDYCLLEKSLLSKDNLLLNFNENDTIRIYEDQLKKFNYFGDENDLPYFEIDLSSKTKQFSGSPSSGITQILYSHLSLSESSFINVSSNLNNNSNIKSGHLGSPIYIINKDNLTDYKCYKRQEDAIKNFFYGFSRGKYRYPIHNLDGFKYGIENGSPLSQKYYFNNFRFGHLSDKHNGTTSYATLKQDIVSKTNIVSYTINKRFVKPNTFNTIDSSNVVNTYNKDVHSRSTHPYIEDSSNQLSQYYVA